MELLPSRSLKYNSTRFTMDCILWWVNIKQLSYLGAPNHTTQAANVATLLGRRWSQNSKKGPGLCWPHGEMMGKWWWRGLGNSAAPGLKSGCNYRLLDVTGMGQLRTNQLPPRINWWDLSGWFVGNIHGENHSEMVGFGVLALTSLSVDDGYRVPQNICSPKHLLRWWECVLL